MSKYKDINTGLEYDNIPEGKVQPIIVNGLPVTELAYDNYSSNNPIELNEVYVTPPPKTLASYYERMANMTPLNYINHINTLKEDERIRKANYWEGTFNVISPSLYVGAARNYYLNKYPFWSNLWYGNSGWFPESVAMKYPITTALINAGLDAMLSKRINNFYKWGTTYRKIGEGASKEAWTTPFSWKVYFKGGDPEYMKELSKIPGVVPYKLEGYDLNGLPIHSSSKVRMVSKPSKRLNRYMTKHHFFPTKVDGDFDYVYLNPLTGEVLTDMERAKSLLNLLGLKLVNPFGRTKLVDPEVLTIPEYFSLLKKGGKLNVRKNRSN